MPPFCSSRLALLPLALSSLPLVGLQVENDVQDLAQDVMAAV